jgi:4-amino-4-deoxy-L-arabinose transferase-like glycosyltransferase
MFVAALSALVLLATARAQIGDTNFYTLWEATNLLGGDHPYRDFYEWGVPLQAYVSALGQTVFGYRILSEFVVQWAFIVAGVVIACDLGLRLSGSRAAVLATMIPAVLLLAVTPTYHYPKLFLYPLAIWLMWRYLDRATPRRAAALGVVTAAAFLFRHDHGVYIGAGAAMAFVLERLLKSDSRNLRLLLVDTAAYLAATLIVLTPWLVAVQRAEGIDEYIQSRAQLYRAWSASTFPLRALAQINPVRELFLRPQPAPKSAVVGFVWSSEVPESQQRLLEAQYGLRPLGRRDEEGRYLFEVANVFDPNLTGLDPFIRNGAGLQFDAIRDRQSRFPSISNAELWLMQVAFIVPAVLLASRLMHVVRLSATATPQPNTYSIIVASTFVLLAESRLFREASYVVLMTPVVAALAAPWLRPAHREAPLMRVVRLAVAVPLFALTLYAVVGWIRGTDIFHPAQIRESLGSTFQSMVMSPPIDAYQPEPRAVHVTRAEWNAGSIDRGAVLIRYMFDCASPGDRALVTGVTPFHVGYYVNLPIAGGHLFWHHKWRSDPVHEQQSLALLRRQSVPFVFSTNDPVFEDFKAYPAILAYLRAYYIELEGSSGLMLVDRRRMPVRRFGELGLPCFR